VFFHAHVTTESIPSGETRIHCPSCGQRDIVARIFAKRETAKAFLVIPFLRKTTWYVVCAGCGTELYSRLNADELSWRTPDDLADSIYVRVSLIRKTLALLSLVMGIFPLVGLAFGVIAVVANRKSRGWPRGVSYLGLGLAVAFHLAFALLMLHEALNPQQRPLDLF
jgi:hypothetical protein